MNDTIVALSSPVPQAVHGINHVNVSPRAIIRLSGPRAIALAAKVFNGLEDSKLRRARIAGVVAWKTHALEACAYVMRAPHSYTREDIVELHVPALPWVLASLLDELLAAGARLAQPGEFTRRAYENGRLTLAQAGAVAALINSLTADEARIQAARLQSHGHGQRGNLRAQMEDLLSSLEFGLDFSTEDAEAISITEVKRQLEHLRASAEDLCATHNAEAENEMCLNPGLPRIVLTGLANAGKSSLFNALLGSKAAIVSGQSHTTRDVVEAACTFETSDGPISALLQDTAGYDIVQASLPAGDEAWGALHRAAWDATVGALRCADVLLILADTSIPLAGQDNLDILRKVLQSVRPAAAAIVWTKADLKPAFSAKEMRDFSSFYGMASQAGMPMFPTFKVSVVNGSGLDELREFLATQTMELNARTHRAFLSAVTAARDGLAEAAAALGRACAGLSAGHGEDIVAVELREALHACGEADGLFLRHDAVTEAALDRIFSRFCVGK